MKTVTYSDKLLPRSRSQHLLVGRGNSVHQFGGSSIPGVCVVIDSRHTKQGKWSYTDYTLELPDDGWTLNVRQGFEDALWFSGCTSPGDVVKLFRAAGCEADDVAISDFMTATFPKTWERLEKLRQERLAMASAATVPPRRPGTGPGTKAVLSTTLLLQPGTYKAEQLDSLPDVVGVPHYVGHPDTRTMLDAAGAVYTPGRFGGLDVGESYLAVPLRLPERTGEAGSVPNQKAGADDIRPMRVTRTA